VLKLFPHLSLRLCSKLSVSCAQVLERIQKVDYKFPSDIPVSAQCKDLISKILVADASKRYTIDDILVSVLPSTVCWYRRCHNTKCPAIDNIYMILVQALAVRNARSKVP
jgi:hypothetical protein